MNAQRGALVRRVLTGAVFLASAFSGAVSRGVAQDLAQPPPAQSSVIEQRDILGRQQWTDTAIDLSPGDVVKFHATGTLDRPAAPPCGPDGRLRDWHDVTARLPINGAAVGSLVGRIGMGDQKSNPFGIGSHHETKVQTAGRLYLGVNEASNESAGGGFHVTIEIVHATPSYVAAETAATSAGTVVEVDASAFPMSGVAQIPLRVTNERGDPGDMVNFVLVGSESAVDQAFKEAGWLKVLDTNKDHRRAGLGGVISSFREKPFVRMPMSQLYLFGRSQDVGYARALPIGAIGSRHHLRLWKAPMQIDGQDVWVGAGTHDESFMHDPHHKGFSHYIDQNVDDERAYIQRSLEKTREAGQWTMIQPVNPVQAAHTVSGQAFNSNGQLLVMWLHQMNPSTAPVIAALANALPDATTGTTAPAGANSFDKN
jgi:hypothetical protein